MVFHRKAMENIFWTQNLRKRVPGSKTKKRTQNWPFCNFPAALQSNLGEGKKTFSTTSITSAPPPQSLLLTSRQDQKPPSRRRQSRCEAGVSLFFSAPLALAQPLRRLGGISLFHAPLRRHRRCKVRVALLPARAGEGGVWGEVSTAVKFETHLCFFAPPALPHPLRRLRLISFFVPPPPLRRHNRC